MYQNRLFRSFLFTLAACACAPSHPVRAQGVADNPAYQSPRGPLPIRDSRPYNLLFLQFNPESGDVLRPHTSTYDVQLDVINNLLIPSPRLGATVVEDNEYQRIRLAWRRGLGRNTEIGVFVPLEWRDGGILDPIISAYHHLLGFKDNALDVPAGRDTYPMYRSVLQLEDGNGQMRVNQGNAFGPGETSVTLKHSLIRATHRSALALRLGVKFPTGNPTLLLGSGSFDEGISLDGRYAAGRDIFFYGNFGGVLMGPASKVPGARRSMLQTLVGIEYRANNRDSYLLQIDGNNQTVRTGNSFADGSEVTATFGVKRVLDRHLLGFASFSEAGHIHNFTLPSLSNIGPAFTVSLGLSWFP